MSSAKMDQFMELYFGMFPSSNDSINKFDRPAEQEMITSGKVPREFVEMFLMSQIISFFTILLLLYCCGFVCGIFAYPLLPNKLPKTHYYIVNGQNSPLTESGRPQPPPYHNGVADIEANADYEDIEALLMASEVH